MKTKAIEGTTRAVRGELKTSGSVAEETNKTYADLNEETLKLMAVRKIRSSFLVRLSFFLFKPQKTSNIDYSMILFQIK